MSVEDNFRQVPRFDGVAWVHRHKPVWVVEYPKTSLAALHWRGFYAIGRVKCADAPWSTDNRLISMVSFKTLAGALRAADGFAIPVGSGSRA